MKPTDLFVNPDFRDAHLTTLDFPEEVTQKICDWVMSPKFFLVFMGTPGIGKSRFCAAMINYLREKYDQTKSMKWHHFYVTEFDFYNGLKHAIGSEGESPDWEIQKLSEMPILILDDIGNEKMTEFQVDSLSELIDKRWMNQLPTVITSNFFRKKFDEVYPKRFVSRLFDARNSLIQLRSDDRREERDR